ncbi:MAG: hypothetical protein WAP23_03210 [Candidatus Spechtbacterales bacterium]
MKTKSIKLNTRFFRDLTFLFEKYEFFVILAGIVIVFLLGGFFFYKEAYRTTTDIPMVEVVVPKVNAELFKKTVEELEGRKGMAPDLPIIDPFR